MKTMIFDQVVCWRGRDGRRDDPTHVDVPEGASLQVRYEPERRGRMSIIIGESDWSMTLWGTVIQAIDEQSVTAMGFVEAHRNGSGSYSPLTVVLTRKGTGYVGEPT